MRTPRQDLPSGTLTFLFTDIEGSTRLLQQVGDRYALLLDEHRRLLRAAFAAEGGVEVNAEGDSFFVVFTSAARAAAAAVAGQRALATFAWPDGAAIRVRMGLHTGEAVIADGDYTGLDVHKAARVMAAGHGGQIVVSDAARSLIEGAAPSGISVRALGEHRLKDLLRPERLYQIEADGLPTGFSALRTLDVVPNNLPTQMTRFVGRQRELAEVRRHLEHTRLLTLTGPGGTGKTRLALQAAAELIEQFPGGVYFIPLAPISDSDLFPSTLASVLGIREATGRPLFDHVLDQVRDRRLLLVIDNFEQLLPAAPLIGQLLKNAPAIKIIVTSRAALHVYGEQEFPVPPMRLPDPKRLPSIEALSQFEAVALFIDRALAAKPDFAVTNESAPAVAGITARLDGLPLAIELAATRVKVLTPEAILSRLERRLTLGGGARDLPARQQTLRDAIAWSYDLLDAPTKKLMARLAVFVGGCALEEAEAVCGPAAELGVDVLDGLAALIDQSLLRQETEHGDARFVMFETIRDFALERLEASGEGDELRRRHAGTYMTLAELAEPHLTGPRQSQWLDRLEREHDNVRAAITWALTRTDADVALRMGAALWRFWQMRGHLQEARDRLTRILNIQGVVDHDAAYARALEAAGGVAYWQGDMPAAQEWYEQCLALYRALGRPSDVARALYDLSFVFGAAKTDLERARALVEESVGLYESLGDTAMLGRVRWALAFTEYNLGRMGSARRLLDSSLEILRQIDDPFSVGWALHLSGLIAIREGESANAEPIFVEALGIFAAARDLSGSAVVLDDLAMTAIASGDDLRAARLAGAAASLVASSGTDLASLINKVEGRSGVVSEKVDPATLAAAWNEGRAMSLDEAVAFALGRSP
jgi:predicted ATPase/class 3 adenylate cyclase